MKLKGVNSIKKNFSLALTVVENKLGRSFLATFLPI
jgi:hypothetical protein